MFPIRDHNPSQRTPYVTWVLIAINVAVWAFGLAVQGSDAIVYAGCDGYAMFPACLTAGQNFISLLTAMFLHGGFLHLAGNMLFLWVFGDNLEEEMGHGPFLAFYIAAGVASLLSEWALAPWSPIPIVGASGAIAGVMGGYLLMFPKAKVDILLFLIVFVRIFPVPAWIVLGLWFGTQMLGGFGADTSQGGVAYWAHVGGFVAGLVMTLPLFLRRGGPEYWSRTHGHPPHPEAAYPLVASSVPKVQRRR